MNKFRPHKFGLRINKSVCGENIIIKDLDEYDKIYLMWGNRFQCEACERDYFTETEHPLELYDLYLLLQNQKTKNMLEVINLQDKKIKKLEETCKAQRKQLDKLMNENLKLDKQVTDLSMTLSIIKKGLKE